MIDDLYWATFDKEKYTCWDFTVDLWKRLNGQDLGKLIAEATGELAQFKKVGKFYRNMVELKKPVSPCIVMMESMTSVPHIGVFYNGQVLHLDSIGPMAQTSFELSRFYRGMRFFTNG